MKLKKYIKYLIIFTIIILLSTLAYSVGNIPTFMLLQGTLKIDNRPAPINTTINAYLEENLIGNFTVKEEGKYGLLILNGKLSYDNKIINFKINNYNADQTIKYASNTGPVELNLTTITEKALKIISYSPPTNPTINEGENKQFSIEYSTGYSDLVFINWYLNEQLVSTENSYTFTSNYESAGIYNIKVNITDNYITKTHSWILTVKDTNRAPVLSPIGDKNVNEGQTITITLSATDPDNDPLAYSVQNAPPNSKLIGTTFSWTPKQPGTYYITFKVSDNKATDSETIKITVNKIPPFIVKIIEPLHGSNIISNTPVTLKAELTGGTPPYKNINWYLYNNIISTGSTATYTFTQKGINWLLTLTAQDSAEQKAMHQIFINVIIPNKPPVLSKIGDKNINVGQTLKITLSATDPDNDLLTYSATDLPETAKLENQTFTWKPTKAGIYYITFKVSDNKAIDSETIKITVNKLIPKAHASANPTSGDVPLDIQFTGSATSGDPPISYYWDFGDGKSSNQQNPKHTYTTPGNYIITLKVTDNDNDNDEAKLAINAKTPIQPLLPPIASFTVIPEKALRGTIFSFDASSSSNPNCKLADLTNDNKVNTLDYLEILKTKKDINNDGKADMLDALFLLKIINSGQCSKSLKDLKYRWDFNSDGNYDTDYITSTTITHNYTSSGRKTIKLEVTNTNQVISTTTKKITVISPYCEYADLTNDGKIDTSDLTELLKLLKLPSPEKGDINQDGKVNTFDMLELLSILNGGCD